MIIFEIEEKPEKIKKTQGNAYENGKVQCKNGLKLFSRGCLSTANLLYYNDYFQFSNIR